MISLHNLFIRLIFELILVSNFLITAIIRNCNDIGIGNFWIVSWLGRVGEGDQCDWFRWCWLILKGWVNFTLLNPCFDSLCGTRLKPVISMDYFCFEFNCVSVRCFIRLLRVIIESVSPPSLHREPFVHTTSSLSVKLFWTLFQAKTTQLQSTLT